MTRDQAVKLMAIYGDINGALGRRADDVAAILDGDEDERRATLSGVAHVMWAVFERCMKPVIAQYPDLDPDR